MPYIFIKRVIIAQVTSMLYFLNRSRLILAIKKKGHALKTLRLLPEIIKLNFPDKDEIILTVHHTNIPAMNLYIKAGFIDKGLRLEGDYGEESIFHFDLDREKKICYNSIQVGSIIKVMVNLL
ncbi:hypothetical protein J2S21_003289 [Peribacillus cavernae]|nr:hypothetical protein [Peribacillus cavernae]